MDFHEQGKERLKEIGRQIEEKKNEIIHLKAEHKALEKYLSTVSLMEKMAKKKNKDKSLGGQSTLSVPPSKSPAPE